MNINIGNNCATKRLLLNNKCAKLGDEMNRIAETKMDTPTIVKKIV